MLHFAGFPIHSNNIPLQFKGNSDGDYSGLKTQGSTVIVDHASKAGYDTYAGRPTPDAFVLNAVLSYVPVGTPILELGCHTGNNLLALDDSRNPL